MESISGGPLQSKNDFALVFEDFNPTFEEFNPALDQTYLCNELEEQADDKPTHTLDGPRGLYDKLSLENKPIQKRKGRNSKTINAMPRLRDNRGRFISASPTSSDDN